MAELVTANHQVSGCARPPAQGTIPISQNTKFRRLLGLLQPALWRHRGAQVQPLPHVHPFAAMQQHCLYMQKLYMYNNVHVVRDRNIDIGD